MDNVGDALGCAFRVFLEDDGDASGCDLVLILWILIWYIDGSMTKYGMALERSLRRSRMPMSNNSLHSIFKSYLVIIDILALDCDTDALGDFRDSDRFLGGDAGVLERVPVGDVALFGRQLDVVALDQERRVGAREQPHEIGGHWGRGVD